MYVLGSRFEFQTIAKYLNNITCFFSVGLNISHDKGTIKVIAGKVIFVLIKIHFLRFYTNEKNRRNKKL